MSQLIKEVGKCELCGSKRGLEVHHIVPISVGGLDADDNKIVVCCGCHAKLTPTSLLTKIGLERTKRNNIKLLALYHLKNVFYETLHEMVVNEEFPTLVDACDVFDKAFEEATNIKE